MKVTHPVKGFSGYVSGPRGFGLHFLGGVAHAKAADIPDVARQRFVQDGFTFVDERRQADEPDGDDSPTE